MNVSGKPSAAHAIKSKRLPSSALTVAPEIFIGSISTSCVDDHTEPAGDAGLLSLLPAVSVDSRAACTAATARGSSAVTRQAKRESERTIVAQSSRKSLYARAQSIA